MGKHRKPEKAAKPAQKIEPDQKLKHKSVPEIRSDWYAVELPPIGVPSKVVPPVPRLVEAIHEHANTLLEAEASEYAKKAASSSTHTFQNKMMADGTWEDRVSVLTLMVQESPLHTAKQFESLLGMAKKKSRDQALLALGALKDMLGQGTVLPSERRLRAFGKQPGLLAALQGVSPQWTADKGLPKGLTNAHLTHWAFEDRLKKGYFELLRIIEGWCGDEVEFARIRAMTYAWELLKDKPEQEENLLRLVVNKLGDRSKKVASKASFLLLELQRFHPAMKPEIVKSVQEDILLRPSQSMGAKYYAVITLNQTILQTAAPEVANALLDVYFDLFAAILNQMNAARKRPEPAPAEKSKKRKHTHGKATAPAERPEQEMTDKINAQILTGINRAFPYSNKDSEKFERHVDTMFRIAHSSNFNTSVQALLLIQQISSIHHISVDRFMRTLYESLLDPRLLKSSKQTVYLNLLYRALKADGSVRRVKAFVKRLLQVLTLHEPPFICAALFLIAELNTLFPSLRALASQPEFQDDDDEETFRDADAEPTTTTPSSHPSASKSYDAHKRDPLHANADNASLWELPTLLHHYHPSIPLFATHLLSPSSVPCPAKPDPSSHTLSHFLDRFAFRNPKTRADAQTRGTSLMQPALASGANADTLITKAGGARGIDGASLNSEAFWSRRAEDVRPEEVFFHKYFADSHRGRKGKAAKAAKKRAGDEGSDFDDDLGEGEDAIWRALTASRPEIEEGGEDDDDDDEELSDDGAFDEAMASDGDAASDGDFGDGGVTLDDLISSSKFKSGEQDGEEEEEDDDGASFDLDDASAINDSGSEAGPGLVGDFADFDDDGDADAAPLSKGGKGKGEDVVGEGKDGKGSERARKRRRIRDLPTFASAEDYAAMLGDSD